MGLIDQCFDLRRIGEINQMVDLNVGALPSRHESVNFVRLDQPANGRNKVVQQNDVAVAVREMP